MTEQELLQELKRLSRKGVQFCVPFMYGGGWCDLNAEKVLAWAKDPIALEAKDIKVTPERLKAYLKFKNSKDNRRCTAITLKGDRCKHDAYECWDLDVWNFLEKEMLCHLHRNRLKGVKRGL